MSFFHAILLGVVEGITEFLPVSSTGHLILTARIFRVPQTDFLKTFEIVIQLGAVFAVIGLYISKLREVFRQVPKLIVAFIPTAIVGVTLYPFIKSRLLGNNQITLWALFIGGVIIIAFELFRKKNDRTHVNTLENISYAQAFVVGLFQSIAVIPGVSRSGATIIGGMFSGITRSAIVEFSFLLALPTIAAAAGLDLVKAPLHFSGLEWGMLVVGLITSFVTALFVLKWFIKYISQHSFLPFGVYRIVVALLGLLIL